MLQEVMVHVPKIMTQTRVRHEHVEQTVEVPIPHTQVPSAGKPEGNPGETAVGTVFDSSSKQDSFVGNRPVRRHYFKAKKLLCQSWNFSGKII